MVGVAWWGSRIEEGYMFYIYIYLLVSCQDPSGGMINTPRDNHSVNQIEARYQYTFLNTIINININKHGGPGGRVRIYIYIYNT